MVLLRAILSLGVHFGNWWEDFWLSSQATDTYWKGGKDVHGAILQHVVQLTIPPDITQMKIHL